jgi:hypothetical protein
VLLRAVCETTAGLILGFYGADGQVGDAGAEVGDVCVEYVRGDKDGVSWACGDVLVCEAILCAALQDVEDFFSDVLVLVGGVGAGVWDVGAVNVEVLGPLGVADEWGVVLAHWAGRSVG